MFTKKYNGVNGNNKFHKSVKYLGKKKRVNKITKKKKTKKRGNRNSGLIRQYGGSGKVSTYCYNYYKDLEIAYLYNTNPEKDFTTELNEIFGIENVEKNLEKQFIDNNDEYIPYFFRLPNDDAKQKQLESKDGLEDPDNLSFNGKNFTGLESTLNIAYYKNKNDINMIIYKIKNVYDDIRYIITKLKTYFNSNKIPYSIIDYIDIHTNVLNNNKKVLGIVKTNDLINVPNKDIKIDTDIAIVCNNKSNENANKNQKDRYVKKSLGYANIGNSCYANSLIQLLKNIHGIQEIIIKYINELEGLKDKNQKKIDVLKKLNEFMFSSKIDIGKTFFNANEYDFIRDKLFEKDKKGQKDSQELLKNLDFYDNENNFIDIVKSYFITITYSKTNEFIKYTLPPKNNNSADIILNVKEGGKYKNIQEILNNYSKGEEIENYIKLNDNPLTYLSGIKQSKIIVDNNNIYVLIQLSLFTGAKNADGSFKGEKTNITINNLNDDICIKELSDTSILDMINNKDFHNNDIDKFPIINYELISVVVHMGGTNGGHYINYSKQIDDTDNKIKWVQYNDPVTNSGNDKLPDDLKNNPPYLYLYKRVN